MLLDRAHARRVMLDKWGWQEMFPVGTQHWWLCDPESTVGQCYRASCMSLSTMRQWRRLPGLADLGELTQGPAGQNGTAASAARWEGTIGNAVGQNQRWEGTDWNGTGAVQHEGLHQGSDWGDVLDMPQPTQTNISSTLEQ